MNFELAKEKALRYLVVAKKTEVEVREKLKKSSCEESIIDDVISYLKELDYINDYEYVDAYIRQCMRLQNYSIYEIKNKLIQKGINKNLLEEKLQNLADTDYEEKLVKKLLSSKLKQMEPLKRKQYLYRRGFKTFGNIDYEDTVEY